MSVIECIILALVEGLTEFLPVSSTGHMILTQGFLGMESTDFIKAFTVMIQFGAILSVVVLYYKRFFLLGNDDPDRNASASTASNKFSARLSFYLKLLIGLLPAVVAGLLLENWIDKMLESVWVVAIMLVLGGVFMLFIDTLFAHSKRERITQKNAFVIGLFQCIAMIPGVSRSMATIVGGLQQGLSRKRAAEFSFFLAVPTMLGATLLKAYKLYQESGMAIFRENAQELIVGNLVAFVVALLAIKFFIGFISRYGFKLFGYYRIAIGMLVIVLLLCGVPLQVA